jgi:hypothetical protein
MATYGYFPISDNDIQRIQTKATQRRIGGKPMTPGELQAAYEAVLNSQAARRDSRYATQLANEKYEKSFAENQRQFNERMESAKDAQEDANKGSLVSAAMKAPVTAIQAYKLYKKMFGGSSVTPESETNLPDLGPEFYEPENMNTYDYPDVANDVPSIQATDSSDTGGGDTDYYDYVDYPMPDVEADTPYMEVEGAEEEAPAVDDEGWCIIVTACCGRYSPEVDITRMFRDKFMSGEQLRGYYCIAEKIVPLMRKSKHFMSWIRNHLVKHFISYGKHVLERSRTTQTPIKAMVVSKAFLMLCKITGTVIKRYIRNNGEVY